MEIGGGAMRWFGSLCLRLGLGPQSAWAQAAALPLDAEDECPPADGPLFDAPELLPSVGSSSAVSLAADDVDNDGLNEVVEASGGSAPAIVVHHRSVIDGSWTSDLTPHTSLLAKIELGDVDGDGDLDVLGWGCGGPYLFDNAAGVILPPIDLYLSSGCKPGALADFDLDGDLDLVASNSVFTYVGYYDVYADFVDSYENTGGGLFQQAAYIGFFETGADLAAGDVDADGDDDIVVHAHDWYIDPYDVPGPGVDLPDRLVVLGNEGGPDQFVQRSSDIRVMPNDTRLMLVDVDDDAIQDLVLTSCEEDQILWLPGLGDAFGSEAEVATGIDCPDVKFAADLDRDDDADLVVASAAGGSWIENTGNATWAEPVLVAAGEVSAAAVADLDMDMDLSLDLAFGFITTDVVNVYLNQSPKCVLPCQCGVGPGGQTPGWITLLGGLVAVRRGRRTTSGNTT